MENADLQVLSQLQSWMLEQEPTWLCTVAATWGSSPRPVGSLLACNSRGHIVGSLSGGCIEEDLLEKLQQGTLARDKPELHVYGETREESDRFGLPCGGELRIVIEPIHIENAKNQANHQTAIDQVIERLAQRLCVERQVDLTSGEMSVSNIERFKHLSLTDDKTLTHSYGPRYQLFLIGAGQTSIYVAEMAKALDYHVIVCDPRPLMIEQWPVDGIQLVNMMPDDAVAKYAADKHSAIVALTHDPRIDDMGLMQALTTDAFFVGALGSTRTSLKRRERLLQLDLSEAQIARLHGPVGLPIGSKTPAEIAISILAQLTSVRAELMREASAESA